MSANVSWQRPTMAGLALPLVILCAVSGRAQEATATLTGTVKDPSGAVVPVVVVTL